MRNILLGFFLLVVGGAIYSSFNLGAYKDVEIKEGPYQELLLVYKDHVGPYHKIGDAIKDVEAWAKEQNIDCKISFGQFLDNPNLVEHERLRSRGGCVVSQIPAQVPENIKTMTVPSRDYIQAQFGGSPWIGPYKVYSKVYDYAGQRKLDISEPVIELYELVAPKEMRTIYLFPIKK